MAPSSCEHRLRAERADAEAWASHFEVIAMDLRGSGGTPASPGGHTTHNLADDVAAVLDHQEIRRAHLLGVSGGRGRVVSLQDANVLVDGHLRRRPRRYVRRGAPGERRAARPVPADGSQVPERTPTRPSPVPAPCGCTIDSKAYPCCVLYGNCCGRGLVSRCRATPGPWWRR